MQFVCCVLGCSWCWCSGLSSSADITPWRKAEEASVLHSRSHRETLRWSGWGSGGGRNIPQYIELSERCGYHGEEERSYVHKRGLQTHSWTGQANRQLRWSSSIGGLYNRSTGEQQTTRHHGYRLHLCILRDPCPSCYCEQGYRASQGISRAGTGRSHQSSLRVDFGSDRKAHTRSCKSIGRRYAPSVYYRTFLVLVRCLILHGVE